MQAEICLQSHRLLIASFLLDGGMLELFSRLLGRLIISLHFLAHGHSGYFSLIFRAYELYARFISRVHCAPSQAAATLNGSFSARARE